MPKDQSSVLPCDRYEVVLQEAQTVDHTWSAARPLLPSATGCGAVACARIARELGPRVAVSVPAHQESPIVAGTPIAGFVARAWAKKADEVVSLYEPLDYQRAWPLPDLNVNLAAARAIMALLEEGPLANGILIFTTPGPGLKRPAWLAPTISGRSNDHHAEDLLEAYACLDLAPPAELARTVLQTGCSYPWSIQAMEAADESLDYINDRYRSPTKTKGKG